MKYKQIIIPVTQLLLALGSVPIAFAQIENPINVNSLEDLIANIINAVLGLTAVVAVAFIVYGGFLYITAQGETSQIEQAKKAIIGAVIGLIVVGLAYAIVAFVIGAVGGGNGNTTNTGGSNL